MERIITTAKEQNSTPLTTSIQYLIKVYFIRFNSPVPGPEKEILSQTLDNLEFYHNFGSVFTYLLDDFVRILEKTEV